MNAMSPAQRKQSEILLPALDSSKLSTSEVANGYAFHSHPAPAHLHRFRNGLETKGSAAVLEFDLHVGDSAAPITLRIRRQAVHQGRAFRIGRLMCMASLQVTAKTY
jgi:hypothetical protein